MIAKTRAEIPFKVSIKYSAHNYCFQKSGWIFFSETPPNYWTHGFPVTAFRENFNVTSYYARNTMVL